MAPVKFGDIPKPAKDVLSDDFQVKDFEFKTKQKTNLSGAVVTSTVDLMADDVVKTPAKISWKIPTIHPSLKGLSVDKLEMDKKGGCKLEASADSKLHCVDGLKVEAKLPDLKNLAKASAGVTYAMKEGQFKIETSVGAPKDFKAEASVAVGPATLGVSGGAKTLTAPDASIRFQQGPLFAAICAKDKFKAFDAYALLKQGDMQVAATYNNKGAYSVAGAYALAKGTTFKAKFGSAQELLVAAKHEVSKGFTLTGGLRYGIKDSKHSYGLALSVE